RRPAAGQDPEHRARQRRGGAQSRAGVRSGCAAAARGVAGARAVARPRQCRTQADAHGPRWRASNARRTGCRTPGGRACARIGGGHRRMSDRRARLRIAWISRLGVLLVRALALTWRVRYVNRGVVDDLRARNEAFIYLLWHGQLLPLLWTHRNRDIAVIISEHRDGE